MSSTLAVKSQATKKRDLNAHITIDNGLVLPESSESKDIERKRKKPSRRRAYQQPCSWHGSEPPKLPGPCGPITPTRLSSLIPIHWA
jgi:hypothetical protein